MHASRPDEGGWDDLEVVDTCEIESLSRFGKYRYRGRATPVVLAGAAVLQMWLCPHPAGFLTIPATVGLWAIAKNLTTIAR